MAGFSSAIKYVSCHDPSGYQTGYEVAAGRYMEGLRKAGVSLTWAPMIPGGEWGLGYVPLVGRLPGMPLEEVCGLELDYDTVVVHTVPEYFPIWKAREPGKRIVGNTVWETDRPPAHWIPILNGIDAVIVPTEWNRDVFREAGVTVPIHVVPHAAPPPGLPPPDRDRFGIPPGDFCFYTINSWTVRKALWLTIEAFLSAFTADDPVCLVVKTGSRDMTRRYLGRFRRSTARAVRQLTARHRRPARVILLPGEMEEAGIRVLHASCDCYVSLTRGEGWGLGAFDAGAHGRPVIMTGWGGQTDYLLPGAAWSVSYRMVPVLDREGRGSYSPDQRWADPDVAQAAGFMREAASDREAAADRGRRLGEFIHERFNSRRVTRLFLDALGSSGGAS